MSDNKKSFNSKKKEKIFLFFLILIFFITNYNFLDNSIKNFFDEREIVFVERIIDGDTIETNKGIVRLLGVDAPEKNEKYFKEATDFLIDKILNQTVRLEFRGQKYDKYKRILAYVFFENKNVNLELIEDGLANPYFPSGKDKYYRTFFNSWEECIINNKNLCKRSESLCKNCIKIKEFNYKEGFLILVNTCNFNCDLNKWKLENEGRKNYFFKNFILEKNNQVKIIIGEGQDNRENIFWEGEKVVWIKSGDTLFLRDNENNLVFWENY